MRVRPWIFSLISLILSNLFFYSITQAQLSPKFTTYQAKIIKPDNTPLEDSDVTFRFTILNPAGSCALYVEQFSSIDMQDSNGLVTFTLGTGTQSFVSNGLTEMFDVFNNAVTSYTCQGGGTYNPTSFHSRKISMAFQIAGLGWQVLPAMAINSVPYAQFANQSSNSVSATFAVSATSALSLNGYTENDFATSAGLAVCPGGEVLTYTVSGFDCVAQTGGASSTLTSLTANAPLVKTGTVSSPILSITQSTSATDGYLSSADWTTFNNKLSATSAAITTALGAQALTVSSTITLSGDVTGLTTSNTVATVGGKTAAQVSTSVDDTLAASAAATANTIAKRDASGNIQFNNIGSNILSANGVNLYNGSNAISFLSPVLASSYTLTFPASAGAVGQVLTTDGSGILSWSSPSAGSLTSVSATAPLSTTGGATPTLSITQATSSTNGYLSSVDWLTFNNKLSTLDLGSVSATGTLSIARLPSLIGDVSSVSGSNNVTVNYVGGLSSATIATAITQTTSASSLNVSNTIVRRDGSGNFAASAGTFENSVVIKDGAMGGAIGLFAATGFTSYNLTLPTTSGTANQVLTTNGAGLLSWTTPSTASASQWTTSGTNIFYNTGNVGIGVSSPIAKLQVDGVLLINPSSFIHNANSSIESAKTGDNYLLLNGSARTGGLAATGQGITLASQEQLRFRTNVSWNGDWNGTGVEAMTILSSGTVGIGTTTPTARLDVSGTLRFAGSTTPVSGGVLTSDASGNATWRLPSSVSASQWTTSGTNIFYNTGNVGIGTNSPGYPIHVSKNRTGTYTIVQGLYSPNVNPGDYVEYIIGREESMYNRATWSYKYEGNSNPNNSMNLFFYGSGSIITAKANGNVGIGTENPVSTLDVSGTVKFAGSTTPVSGGVLTSDASGNATWRLPASASATQWTTSGTSIFYNTGNIGIGVSSPTSKLQLEGTETSAGATNIYQTLSTLNILPTGPVTAIRSNIYAVTSVSATNTQTIDDIRGMFSYATAAGTGNVGSIYGGRFYGEFNGTTAGNVVGSFNGAGTGGGGNTTNLIGTQAVVLNYGGNIVSMTGLTVEANHYSGITANRYGIYLRSPAGTTTTSDYGVYQEGSQSNYFRGNVGVGTTAPRAALDVSGTVLFKPSTANTTTTINFALGNLQHTANDCGTFALHNMLDGGSYTFAVKGTNSTLCVFNAFSGAGVGALTVHMPTDHGLTTATKHTLYSFLVMGSDVYVTWMPGL